MNKPIKEVNTQVEVEADCGFKGIKVTVEITGELTDFAMELLKEKENSTLYKDLHGIIPLVSDTVEKIFKDTVIEWG